MNIRKFNTIHIDNKGFIIKYDDDKPNNFFSIHECVILEDKGMFMLERYETSLLKTHFEKKNDTWLKHHAYLIKLNDAINQVLITAYSENEKLTVSFVSGQEKYMIERSSKNYMPTIEEHTIFHNKVNSFDGFDISEARRIWQMMKNNGFVYV